MLPAGLPKSPRFIPRSRKQTESSCDWVEALPWVVGAVLEMHQPSSLHLQWTSAPCTWSTSLPQKNRTDRHKVAAGMSTQGWKPWYFAPSQHPFLQGTHPYSQHKPSPFPMQRGFSALIFRRLPAMFTVTGFLTSHESHSQGEIWVCKLLKCYQEHAGLPIFFFFPVGE